MSMWKRFNKYVSWKNVTPEAEALVRARVSKELLARCFQLKHQPIVTKPDRDTPENAREYKLCKDCSAVIAFIISQES